MKESMLANSKRSKSIYLGVFFHRLRVRKQTIIVFWSELASITRNFWDFLVILYQDANAFHQNVEITKAFL